MRTNLTFADRRDIYEHLQELVDLASSQEVSIYAGFDGGFNPEDSIGTIRGDLERTYKVRFVHFKDVDTYITDLTCPEQWTFALFVAEFILHENTPK
jgi:hypothetical protein